MTLHAPKDHAKRIKQLVKALIYPALFYRFGWSPSAPDQIGELLRLCRAVDPQATPEMIEEAVAAAASTAMMHTEMYMEAAQKAEAQTALLREAVARVRRRGLRLVS